MTFFGKAIVLALIGSIGLMLATVATGGHGYPKPCTSAQDQYGCTTTTSTQTTTQTTTSSTPPEIPCGGKGLPNPPGGKDGHPGNDDCVTDTLPTQPQLTISTQTTPAQTVPTPPVTTSQETTTSSSPTPKPKPRKPTPEPSPEPSPRKPHKPHKPPHVCPPGQRFAGVCAPQGSG